MILTCVGFAQRALPDDHPVRDDVEEIGRAADRAAALTRQLLMFSRREVVKPQVVDVGALVRDLERLLEPHAVRARRAADLVRARPSCRCSIDPAQLEQVLVNLAVNARDAMPDGGTLSIAVSGDEGGVRITVADDGTGMPAEVRERAFEPFFTTKEPGRGHRPRARHASTASSPTRAARSRSSSEVGGGTVVTIFLPAAEQSVAAPEAPTLPAPAAAAATRGCSSSRTRTRSAARRAGSSRRTATPSPRRRARDEALAGWGPVDVLVTDVVMPGMSGQQLAEHARERRPSCGSSSCRATPTTSSSATGRAHGDIAFVQKPFTRDSLLRAVEEALQKPPPAGSNGASARPERPPPRGAVDGASRAGPPIG